MVFQINKNLSLGNGYNLLTYRVLKTRITGDQLLHELKVFGTELRSIVQKMDVLFTDGSVNG